MDIVGKLYKDFFINKFDLDGRSHMINKYELGGIGNILNQKKFINKVFTKNKDKFFILTNSNVDISNLKNNLDDVNYELININQNLPYALIFDTNNSRTSYILNDDNFNIEIINSKSSGALIFYGDKISFSDSIKYQKLFIDTAGNKYQDLFFNFNKISKEIIVSISEEYLTEELKNFYLKLGYKILAHKPEEIKFITRNKITVIKNKFYIPDLNIKVTGLGDKFFTIFAKNCLNFDFDPIDSASFSQRELLEYVDY